MEQNVYVEKYVKRKGGKWYCDVYFHWKGTSVVVKGICTDDKQVAINKAKEIMESTIKTF